MKEVLTRDTQLLQSIKSRGRPWRACGAALGGRIWRRQRGWRRERRRRRRKWRGVEKQTSGKSRASPMTQTKPVPIFQELAVARSARTCRISLDPVVTGRHAADLEEKRSEPDGTTCLPRTSWRYQFGSLSYIHPFPDPSSLLSKLCLMDQLGYAEADILPRVASIGNADILPPVAPQNPSLAPLCANRTRGCETFSRCGLERIL
ncbi:uncharacterized protein LOC123448923 [Hordeum vulgare subsp. vulgare]|uniref:uncharacterized protein LOC123448923 n=1 Tax=Hordeum vulgare subsp. vulgare TaxID=112509 RepID=UPI000B47B4EA|nr:uncharacterized protein LOC123448923 [Hordeum vulgare subsp. vulgare]